MLVILSFGMLCDMLICLVSTFLYGSLVCYVAFCCHIITDPSILTEADVVVPALKVLPINYWLFQESHVSNLPASFWSPLSCPQSFAANMRISSNVSLSFDLGTWLVQSLFEESHSLSVFIQDLQGIVFGLTSRRVAIDYVL